MIDYGTATCPICGTVFPKNGYKHTYCSNQCYGKAYRTSKKPEPKTTESIGSVNEKARAEHLSYGFYVSKHLKKSEMGKR